MNDPNHEERSAMREKNDEVSSTTDKEDVRADEVPEIEPPCPDCVRVRAETRDPEAWCDRHTRPHRDMHVYNYRRELPFAQHDSSVIPTGIERRKVR